MVAIERHNSSLRGIEFLRSMYLSSGLSIRPRTKRGHRWALTRFAFDVYGESESDISSSARISSSKVSYKMTKIVEAKSIEYEESGDFVGTGKWTFEPTDGKTKVQFRLNVRINRLLISLVSPFVNMEKTHSDNAERIQSI